MEVFICPNWARKDTDNDWICDYSVILTKEDTVYFDSLSKMKDCFCDIVCDDMKRKFCSIMNLELCQKN